MERPHPLHRTRYARVADARCYPLALRWRCGHSRSCRSPQSAALPASIMRVVHLRLDEGHDVVRLRRGGKAAFIGDLGDRFRNMGRDLADPRQRWIKAALLDIF